MLRFALSMTAPQKNILVVGAANAHAYLKTNHCKKLRARKIICKSF
jgi:hypothetical protein